MESDESEQMRNSTGSSYVTPNFSEFCDTDFEFIHNFGYQEIQRQSRTDDLLPAKRTVKRHTVTNISKIPNTRLKPSRKCQSHQEISNLQYQLYSRDFWVTNNDFQNDEEEISEEKSGSNCHKILIDRFYLCSDFKEFYAPRPDRISQLFASNFNPPVANPFYLSKDFKQFYAQRPDRLGVIFLSDSEDSMSDDDLETDTKRQKKGYLEPA